MKKPLLCSIGILSLLLVGCGSKEEVDSRRSHRANKFTYPIVANLTTLDPSSIVDVDTYNVLLQCCDTLVAYDTHNKIYPQLAESWKIENSGKTFVFHLRQGIKFSNGQELTAEDVEWTINRNLSPEISSPNAEMFLGDIVGAAERMKGKAKSVKGIRVLDKYTIAFDLVEPRPYFLEKMTYLTAAPLARESVPATAIKKPEELIGVGPFILEDYQQDQMIALKKNEHYYGGSPKIDGIICPIIKDPVMRLQKYQNGELDMMLLERRDIPAIKDNLKLKTQLKFYVRPSLYHINLNIAKNDAFKDVRVRQAISMAIDKDYLVKEVLKGVNVVANSIIPPGVLGYRPNFKVQEFNPAKAVEILKETAYGPGKKPISFEIVFQTGRADLQMVAESIALQLKTNIGAQVVLKPLEWSTYLKRHHDNINESEHGRWLNDYLDPQNSISIHYHSKGNENHIGYSNAEVDGFTEKADRLMDEKERASLYQHAEEIILREAAVIPIYFQRDAVLINPRVRGLRNSSMMFLPHKDVELMGGLSSSSVN